MQTFQVNFDPNSKPDLSTPEGKRAYQREWAKRNRPKCRVWASAYYRRNTERVKAQARAYAARKKVEMQQSRIFSRHVWKGMQERAEARELEFSINREDYPIPEICPALGLTLDWRDRNHTPSMDRIDNYKGYIPENVVVVSTRANMIKSDLTIGQLVSLGRFYNSLVST